MCGWNIFDMLIVTASIMDLIFELVDGLSVLRGLRLVRLTSKKQLLTHLLIFFSFTVKSFKTSTIVDNNASSS